MSLKPILASFESWHSQLSNDAKTISEDVHHAEIETVFC